MLVEEEFLKKSLIEKKRQLRKLLRESESNNRFKYMTFNECMWMTKKIFKKKSQKRIFTFLLALSESGLNEMEKAP